MPEAYLAEVPMFAGNCVPEEGALYDEKRLAPSINPTLRSGN